MLKYLRRWYLASFILLFLLVSNAQATMLDVLINTSPLSGTSAQLAFDFIDGDFAINNTVTVSDFSTDGVLGVPSNIGDVTGTLPGDVTIGDAFFFNELLQPIELGTSIAFTLTLTENNAGGLFPDAFSFFVLDASFFPLFPTTDPFGADALFAMDITGSVGGDLQVYAATDNPPPMTWSVTTSAAIPEPSMIILLGIGLLSLSWRRSRCCF